MIKMIKKFIALTISLFWLNLFSFAQVSEVNSKLLPEAVCLNGNTAYINRLGNVVLNTSFPYYRFQFNTFSDGLVGFKTNNKYGYIDETGRVIVEPFYDTAREFSEGFAETEINEKWGFIDKTGKIIVKPQFDKVWSFSEGFALVAKIIGANEEGTYKYKWGFIDKTGQIVIGKTKKIGMGEFDDADDFSEGLAPVRIGKKWGYVNNQGIITIKLQFKEAKRFSEGLAPVSINGKKWGFIDKTGKVIIKPQFTAAEPFSEGLAQVSDYLNGWSNWGFIDKTGTIVIKPQFSYSGRFKEGRAIIRQGLGFGYIDTTGKVVIQPQFGGAGHFKNGIAWVYVDKNGGSYIDKTGKVLWKSEGDCSK